jgi:hypothetical protein
MIRRFLSFTALSLSSALLIRCGMPPLSSGGGGTDFPNTKTVAGVLISADGTPSPHTKVQLIPRTFNPVADRSLHFMEDTTDTNGTYRFSPADTGLYTISAVQLDAQTRAMICGIHVDKDTVRVAPAKMLKPGAIKVTLPEGSYTADGYIYVPGTTMAAMLYENSGFAMLDSVPAGLIPSVNYGEEGNAEVKVIRYDIPVSPKDISEILYPSWDHAKTVLFNTTSSGAAVAGNMIGFPVLVRLSSGNFNFAEARGNGGDIRFAKTDGTPLFYEIEAWDSAKASAALWVRIDTIFGNNNSQNIMMYWGAPHSSTGRAAALTSASNGATVFDTANGFQGVWHFSGPAAEGSTAVDATANGYNGVPKGTIPGSVQGIIGNANVFSGAGFIEMPGTAGSTLNFPQHGSYSLSAWVNMDSLAGEYQMIASKGDKQYNLQFKGATKNWQFTEYQDTTGWDETASGAVAKSWVYLVGVRSNQKQYLYVNGVCTDSSIYNLPFSPSDTTYAERHGYRNTMCNFMIGKKVDYNAWFFKGMIDEVRVSSKARSPDWIKLSYMNQKINDMLVVYK